MNLVKQALPWPALAGLLFMAFAAGASAWSGNLGGRAILPFTGETSGEREGIPELLSFTPEMMQSFSVMPRIGITNATRQEQSFQAGPA
jgi:hypothetical protein